MKAGIPPAEYKILSPKKIVLIIVLILSLFYLIGRLQVGTDDKKETQKRSSTLGASFISSTAQFPFVVVSV